MKKLLIFALLLIILPTAARAEVDIIESQYEALGGDELKDALTGEAKDMLEGVEIKDGSNFTEGLKKILGSVGTRLGEILRKGISSAAILIVIAILTSLSETIYESLSSGSAPNYIHLIGTIAIAGIAVSDVGSFLRLGSNTVSELSAFSKVLLPTLTAAAAAGGAVTSAAAKYAATALFLDILITVAERVLVPLIYAYTASVVACAAIGGEALSGAVNVLKWVANVVLTAVVLLFIAYLTISGVVTGTAYALTTRVAKTTISTILPVVGGIISDAASSILAGANMLRNAIGIYGLLGVTAMCIIPFLRLAVQYLCYKFAAGITAAVSASRISKLIGGIGTAFGLMMGVTGSAAVILYFSIISLIKAVGI
jgi:stage III sporulation protein AE